MKRLVIRFKDGEQMNIPADFIDLRDGFIMVWDGDNLVAIVSAEMIISCHLSEKKG